MNPTLSTCDITLELLAIQDHIRKKPAFELGNLLAVAGWHAVAELLYVSRCLCPCDLSDTECTAQRNILYWETANPRWNFPSTSMRWPSTFGRPRIGSPTARSG